MFSMFLLRNELQLEVSHPVEKFITLPQWQEYFGIFSTCQLKLAKVTVQSPSRCQVALAFPEILSNRPKLS